MTLEVPAKSGLPRSRIFHGRLEETCSLEQVAARGVDSGGGSKEEILFILLHSHRSKHRSFLKEYTLNNNNDFKTFHR